MRVIRLSKSEFSTRSEVDHYFQSPSSELHERGFIFTMGWIAADGVESGELVVFTYDSVVVYVTEATGPREEYIGPEAELYPFRLPLALDRLQPAAVPLQEFLSGLGLDAEECETKAHSQGWLRQAITVADRTKVEELARVSVEHPTDILVEEGTREERSEVFLKRNAIVVAECLERDAYTCKVCGFSLHVAGRNIVDCHHLVPMYEGKRRTTADDLITLCPTCHRIAHARRPPFTPMEIRALVPRGSTAQSATGDADKPRA